MLKDALIIQSSPTPTASVIWLHGLGADGNDFAPVVQMLHLPHIRFILPHAPYRPVTLNNGYEMRAWYDILGLQADSPQDEAGIRAMQLEIEALIQAESDWGIASDRIVLAGFSQGGAIALHTATRVHVPLAGVLALSTYLPLRNRLSAELNAINQTTPIWMAHGQSDTVIAPTTALLARDTLRTAGLQVEWHAYEMAHSVCEEEINDIRSFLLRVLPPRE